MVLNISTQFGRQSAKRKEKKRKSKRKEKINKRKELRAKKLCLIWIYFFISKRKNSGSGEQKLRHEKGGEIKSPLP